MVGCMQFSSPAWRIGVRDAWVGWDDDTRRRNLQRLVNNSRFLILPWVRVKNPGQHDAVAGRAAIACGLEAAALALAEISNWHALSREIRSAEFGKFR